MQRDVTRPRSGADPAFPRLLGDRLCLDFANTIEAPLHAPQDFLGSYPDLVGWGRHTALLTGAEVETLLAEASRDPAAATKTFADAITLRCAIQRTFAAVAAGNSPTVADLATIREHYLSGLTQARLTEREGSFDWTWDGSEHGAHLGRMLWPVVRSAIELLTEGDLHRVKQCAGPDGCGWLFYDTSKNGSRRWCSMEGCGSRAKMRRYNERRRLARG